MKKYFSLAITFLFCNATQAAVYMIDFKCEPEAYEVFASMTLDELDAQFLSKLLVLRILYLLETN